MPDPAWVSVPEPEITFATVIEFDRLKMRAPLLSTLPVPSAPAVPPLPIWSVPVLMVVVPVYVLAPVRIVVPVPPG